VSSERETWSELRERARIQREQYEPTRATFQCGISFFCNSLDLDRRAAADELDSLSPDFPDDCCTGRYADALPRLISPDYMLAWAGAEVSGEIGTGRSNTCFDVREVPHHPASAAAVLEAWCARQVRR
jgi:hypothetical protein